MVKLHDSLMRIRQVLRRPTELITRGATLHSVVCLSLVLMAAAPGAHQPERTVTTQVAEKINLGSPHLFLVVAVGDDIAEISNGYIIPGRRPYYGHIDWFGTPSGAWKPAPESAGKPDVTDVQLATVENGLHRLGFARSAIHVWKIAAAANTTPSVWNIGEISIDLGPFSVAQSNMDRLTHDNNAPMLDLEKQAKTTLAPDGIISFQPDCESTISRVQIALDASAGRKQSQLEEALGLKLRRRDVNPSYPSRMLCPDLHPVTIGASFGEIQRLPSYRELGFVGTARFDILGVRPRSPQNASPLGSTTRDVPAYFETTDVFARLNDANARFIGATEEMTFEVPPSTALLSFDYGGLSPVAIDAKVQALISNGFERGDIALEPSFFGGTSMWVRLNPPTLERAHQVEAITGNNAPRGDNVSLFLDDCNAQAAAIGTVYQAAKANATDIASAMHASLQLPLSISITSYGYGTENSTCGYVSTETTEQLAEHDLPSGHLPYPGPIVARYGTRIDAAWSYAGAAVTSPIANDKTYTASSTKPSCLIALRETVQSAVSQALSTGPIWALIEDAPEILTDKASGACTKVEATIHIMKHP